MGKKRLKKDSSFTPIKLTSDELNQYKALDLKLRNLKLMDSNIVLTIDKTTRTYYDTIAKLNRNLAEVRRGFENEKVPYDVFMNTIKGKYNLEDVKKMAIDEGSGVISLLDELVDKK